MVLFGSRVALGTGLVAKYGVNKFVVKWPRSLEEDYSEALRHMTFYGRLINTDYIINLDMSFEYDSAVSAGSFSNQTLCGFFA
jgi:hypothetical protein